MIRVGWCDPPERVRRVFLAAMGTKVLSPGRFTYRESDNAYVWEPPPDPEPPRDQHWLEIWELSDGSCERNYTTQPAP